MKKQISLTKKVTRLFQPFWKDIFFVLFLMLIGQVFGLLSPYVIGRSIDALSTDITTTFIWITIGLISFIIKSQILVYFREKYEIKNLDSKINTHLGNVSLSKMLTFSIGQHTSEHSGVKQSIVSQGQSSIYQLIFDLMYNILPTLIQISVTLIVLFFFSKTIAVFCIVIVALFILFSIGLNLKYKKRIEELRNKNQEDSKTKSEIFRNMSLTILEGQEKKAQTEFNDSSEKVRSYEISLWTKYIEKYFILRIFIGLGQYGSLALAAYFIYTGEFKAGMFITIFGWINGIFGPVEQIAGMQRKIMTMLSQIKKYLSLLEIEPDIKDLPNAETLKEVRGKIEFRNVSFTYPKREEKSLLSDASDEGEEKNMVEEETISQISFIINPGEKIGIVGESGSGKSTVINLLRRYYDTTEGEILIDDYPLKNISLASIRKHIGNVEQDVSLFDKSIRENIVYSLNGDGIRVTNMELDKITEMASINDFIHNLPNNYETVIGEKGIKLSGGERQRIAIARALIKNPKILIFDEATSALDSNNEKIIHDAINESSKGRTTIIVAHRLSTVIDADKIFVMSKGKLVATGKHEELQKKSKEYRELIKNQIVAF